ncbi:unnamed protein product [Pleuronectes platessa]|uniref:Uncharacterized protein n=1 Tax=Pleuronectes platessa TaxID=8262 RepID=A0A9N7UZC4_PLEPL|nr:unnamed protein product [Pleuronectes platessa]
MWKKTVEHIRQTQGQFLWVNNSAFGGPWVLSPWLWGGQVPCSLDLAMFLHPKQSGQYTIWLIERDKSPRALLSTDTLPRITGVPMGTEFRLNTRYFGMAVSQLLFAQWLWSWLG